MTRCVYKGQGPQGAWKLEPQCEAVATYTMTIGLYGGGWWLCDRHMHRVVELYSPLLGSMWMRIYKLVDDDFDERIVATLRALPEFRP